MRPFILAAATMALTFGTAGLAHANLFNIGENTISDVAERVSPAVVSISTEGEKVPGMQRGRMPPGFFFFGPGGPGGMPHQGPQPGGNAPSGVASGVIISGDGYIVTNNHVVAHAAKVTVHLNDNRAVEAKVIGTDEAADLALVKVDAKDLPHLSFGDSDKLRLGQVVLAVGNPFGVGQTVTMGIVSAKGRSHMGIEDYEDFIQTDAAINPGNSGGALVDLEGNLVGINTAILSRSGGAQGIGFAVPSTMVRPIVAQLREHGKVSRGWLGVAIQDVTHDLKTALKLTADRGAMISDVLETGPAKKAGLESGDVVVSLEGRPVESAAAFRNAIGLMAPGTKTTLTVARGGRTQDIKVTLEERQTKNQIADNNDEENALGGVRLEPLSRELREQLELPPRVEGGVLVQEVDPESRAAQAGLRPGDVIIGVGQHPVHSTGEVDAALSSKKTAVLRVWRDGTALFLVVRG